MPVLPVAKGNSPDGHNLTLDEKMALYDFLPPAIRVKLATAPYDYDPASVLRAWDQSGLTDIDFANTMHLTFEQDMVKRNYEL